MQEAEHPRDSASDAANEEPGGAEANDDARPFQFSLGRLLVVLLVVSVAVGLFAGFPQQFWPLLAVVFFTAMVIALCGFIGALFAASMWLLYALANDHDLERKANNVRIAQRMFLWCVLAIAPFLLLAVTLIARVMVEEDSALFPAPRFTPTGRVQFFRSRDIPPDRARYARIEPA